jgi:hypothetical protein
MSAIVLTASEVVLFMSHSQLPSVQAHSTLRNVGM